MPYYLKIINLFLWTTVKYFYGPIYGFTLLKLDFWETMLTVIPAGFTSFFTFYFITDLFLVYVRHLKPVVVYVTPNSTRLRYNTWKTKRREKAKGKKTFTRRNKFFVRIRRNYGMWGIVALTPIVLSIPVGAFLLRKYYGHRKEAIPAALFALALEGLLTGIVFWTFF
jgi:hypothetical protein